MRKHDLIVGIAIGWFGLLIVKYLVVGLIAWDRELHPMRIESKADIARYGKPFLGFFS